MKARITPSSQAHHGALPGPGHRPRRRGAQRGAVLLVSLGVLFLLAMFAVSFAQMTALERAASANHITRIESSTVCSGGLQAGIQVIRSYTRENGVTRFGAALDQSGNLIKQNEVPHPFFIPGEPRDDPTTSGRRFGTHKGSLTGSGRYEVRVIDCSGQININDTLDDSHTILRRMLITLGKALEAREDLDFNPLSEADVTAIIAARLEQPGGVFASKEAVFRALPAQSASGKNRSQRFAAFRDFITAHSWRDGSLVLPTPDLNPPGTDPADQQPPLPRTYVDDQGTGLLVAARSPVNINVAPAEVITAVLTGVCANAYKISGEDTAPVRAANPVKITQLGAGTDDLDNISAISFDQARAIAATIVTWRSVFKNESGFIDPRGPFESWSQLERFILALVPDSGQPPPYTGELGDAKGTLPANLQTALDSLTRGQAQAIIANADPNPRLVGVQPADPARLQTDGLSGNQGILVDKAVVRFVPDPDEPGTRLDNGTTEFCLGSTGYFEVVSIGRMATWNDLGTPENIHDDEPIREFARQGHRVTVRLFHTLRHTSQLDFKLAYERATKDLPNTTKPSFEEARTSDGLRFESHPNLATSPSAVDGWLQLASPGRDDILRRLLPTTGLPPVVESFDAGPDEEAPGQVGEVNELTLSRDTGSLLRGGDGSSTTQDPGDPGDFGPDGMVCWANTDVTPGIPDHMFIPAAPSELEDDTVDSSGAGGTDTAVNVGQGSIEFWYRPLTGGDFGSNEPLIHLVRRGPRNGQISNFAATNASDAQKDVAVGAGMCLRVSRYGDRFIAVIFYWGLPEGSLPPEPLINRFEQGIQPNAPAENPQDEFKDDEGPFIFREVVSPPLSELIKDVNGRDTLSRAGEWHHFVISWKNLTELSFFIDGENAGDGSTAGDKRFLEDADNGGNDAGVERSPSSGGTIDATGGTGANTFLRRIGPDGEVDETDGGELGGGEPTITGLDAIKLVRLISQSPRNRLYVGGIQDTVGANFNDVLVNVHGPSVEPPGNNPPPLAAFDVVDPEGLVNRGTNAVIDDVIIYRLPVVFSALATDHPGELALDGSDPSTADLNFKPKRFELFNGNTNPSPLQNGVITDQRSQFIGAFALPQLPPSDEALAHTGSYELGTVHFTVRQPRTWQGISAKADAIVRVGTRGEVVAFDGSAPKGHLQVTEVTEVASGSSLPRVTKDSNNETVNDPDRSIPLSTTSPPRIFYQVEFTNSDDQASRNSTPLFDDITVTVFPPSPQIVEQLFDSEIN